MSAPFRLRPSAAPVWGSYNGCPGSVQMTQGYEHPVRPESTEGTAAHEVGMLMLKRFAQQAVTPIPADYIGRVMSKGIVVDEEIYESAEIYALDVAAVIRTTRVFGGEYLGIESALEMPSIGSDCGGTCDSWIYVTSPQHIYLWDFKHGHGIVDAFENWQCLCYLQGIVDRFKIDGAQDQTITVHIRIIQPRAYHQDGPVREWVFKLSDVRGHFNTLIANAVLARAPKPLIRSGDQCRYCEARHECVTARKSGMDLYEQVADGGHPEKMSNEALGSFYACIQRAQDQIKYLESGIGEEIKARLKAGQIIPGYGVELAYGRETWNVPPAEVIALGELSGVSLRKEDVITPTQAKKAGLSPEIVAAYSGRPLNGVKVVQDDNSKARRVFLR